MTTLSQAFDALKSRITSAATIPVRWPNEDAGPLPGTPAAFAFVDLVTEPGQLAAFGGGRGNNRYRNPAELDIYVFVPKGEGFNSATDKAEIIAAALRSYRDDNVSCFDATVHPGADGATLKPPGLESEVGNYWWACAEVSLFYDQIG